MKFRVCLMLLAALASMMAGAAEDWGEYIGNVVTEWLDEGREMKLVEDFAYRDQRGQVWNAPAGSIVDGASIPRLAWVIIGGPFEGKYRNASVIHDVACDEKNRSWEEVHYAFYTAMRTSGVGETLAKVMYGAVYHFGPRWERRIELAGVSKGEYQAQISQIRAAADNSDIEVSGYSLSTEADRPLVSAEIAITPRPKVLKESDFDELRLEIEASNLSIEAIQNFSPARSSRPTKGSVSP